MAEIVVDPAHPNVLLVIGQDIVGSDVEFRFRLRDFLYGENRWPVLRGSHDFWITYRAPMMAGDNSNHWLVDMGVSPRPMRGIIFMTPPADDSDGAISGHLGTLLQEVGHQWLVPEDLRFRNSGGEIGMVSQRDIVARHFDDVSLAGPPLIGRLERVDGGHWSTYFQADASPLDGVKWNNRGSDQRVTRWDQADPSGRSISMDTSPDYPNGPPFPRPARTISVASTFNDLDRVIIDALPPAGAYPGRANEARWLEPFLTSNTKYHAGITVAFSRFDQIYFGFREDHRKLAVQRTGGPLSTVADLGDAHDLWSFTSLRVVRRGRRLLFQAAGPGADLVTTPSNDTPVSGPVTLSNGRFLTVASAEIPVTPVAAGILLKTWASILVEADYREIVLSDRNGRRAFPVDRDPPEFNRDADYASALSERELRRFDVRGPVALPRASEVRTRDGMLELRTRYAVNRIVGDPVGLDDADLWTGVDRAPKALVKVRGDFVLGTKMRIRRSIFGPATAGGARGCSMWGHPGALRVRDVVVPESVRSKWAGDRNLRFAFIVVAPARQAVTEGFLTRIDTVRRFWNTYFPDSTARRWLSNSQLAVAIALPTVGVEAIQRRRTALGWLGNATGDIRPLLDGGLFQDFQNGSLYWHSATGVHEAHGAIRDRWRALGAERRLGYPLTDETTTPDGVGRYNHFQRGSIYWTPQTGAHEVYGAIRERWKALGWERGYLRYPTTGERNTPGRAGGRFNNFQGGHIWWTANDGPHDVQGRPYPGT